MKMESIINFRVGDRVKYNPANHGYKFLCSYEKVKDREGIVKVVEERVDLGGEGSWGFTQVRTGRITVEWDGIYETRIVHYSRLIIINK